MPKMITKIFENKVVHELTLTQILSNSKKKQLKINVFLLPDTTNRKRVTDCYWYSDFKFFFVFVF